MKKAILLLLYTAAILVVRAQDGSPTEKQRKALTELIDRYSEARDKSDTVLLKSILTTDVDQLVSNGEWRRGIRSAIEGMLKSSGSNPGDRTLRVESIRLFNPTTAMIDCRYEIKNTDGTARKMWSSFTAVTEEKRWKISAIRNMLPGGN